MLYSLTTALLREMFWPFTTNLEELWSIPLELTTLGYIGKISIPGWKHCEVLNGRHIEQENSPQGDPQDLRSNDWLLSVICAESMKMTLTFVAPTPKSPTLCLPFAHENSNLTPLPFSENQTTSTIREKCIHLVFQEMEVHANICQNLGTTEKTKPIAFRAHFLIQFCFPWFFLGASWWKVFFLSELTYELAWEGHKNHPTSPKYYGMLSKFRSATYCVTNVIDLPDRPARAVLPTRWI